MKQLVIWILMFTTLALAGAIRTGSTKATGVGSNVTIQWGSADETYIKEFVIERRSGTMSEFISIAVVNKKGSNSLYEFIDKSAFKTTGSVYYYRIKAVTLSGGAEYSDIMEISLNVSSVKRTWGSLKAMFR